MKTITLCGNKHEFDTTDDLIKIIEENKYNIHISPECTIGNDCEIESLVIGGKSSIGNRCKFTGLCVIDRHCKIGNNCKIEGYLVIQSHCKIGDNCEIIDDYTIQGEDNCRIHIESYRKLLTREVDPENESYQIIESNNKCMRLFVIEKNETPSHR